MSQEHQTGNAATNPAADPDILGYFYRFLPQENWPEEALKKPTSKRYAKHPVILLGEHTSTLVPTSAGVSGVLWEVVTITSNPMCGRKGWENYHPIGFTSDSHTQDVGVVTPLFLETPGSVGRHGEKCGLPRDSYVVLDSRRWFPKECFAEFRGGSRGQFRLGPGSRERVRGLVLAREEAKERFRIEKEEAARARVLRARFGGSASPVSVVTDNYASATETEAVSDDNDTPNNFPLSTLEAEQVATSPAQDATFGHPPIITPRRKSQPKEQDLRKFKTENVSPSATFPAADIEDDSTSMSEVSDENTQETPTPKPRIGRLISHILNRL